MKVLVIGAGLVGTLAGARLRELGHEVAATTTTPGKVEGLREKFDEVLVLRGSDRDAVRAALEAATRSSSPPGRTRRAR